MKDCYYYFFVEPLVTEYNDSGDVTPLTEVQITTSHGNRTLAFLGSTNQIRLIRLLIPACPEEKIPESELEMIQSIKGHVMSVLRLCYDSSAQLFHGAVWHFVESGSPPTLNLKYNQFVNPNWKLDVANLRNTFVTGFPIRSQLKLVTDAFDKSIPPQYRYLSLYKLIEHEYRGNKGWDPALEVLLSKYEKPFIDLKVSAQPLRNYIHSLRDRCAHIKGRGDLEGITTLSNEDMLEIEKVLPLFAEIGVAVINLKHANSGIRLIRQAPSYS